MKKFLPGRTEVLIFLAAALICAGIVQTSEVYDLSLSLLSIPVFICAALMGMHRSGFLRGTVQQPVRQEEDTD